MANNLENHLEWLCNWALQKIYSAPTLDEVLEIETVFDNELRWLDINDINTSLRIMIESVQDALDDLFEYYS